MCGLAMRKLANERVGNSYRSGCMERRIRAKDPMTASIFGGSSVKRYVISVSRMAGRSQRPRVSHRSRGLSPMKVDLGVGGCVKRDGSSLRHEWGVVRGGSDFETAVFWEVAAARVWSRIFFGSRSLWPRGALEQAWSWRRRVKKQAWKTPFRVAAVKLFISMLNISKVVLVFVCLLCM